MSSAAAEPGFDTLRDDFLAALVAADSTRARHLIGAALDAGAAVDALYLRVLEPALEEVGRLWRCGRLNVAYEHYATTITQGILATLGPQMRRAPTGGRLAVVACTPGELHVVGAHMVADFLEADGWEVLLLGQATPARDLAALVDEERPDVVALSTTTAELRLDAQPMLDALAGLPEPPFVVLGGQGWRGVHPPPAPAGAVVGSVAELLGLVRARFPAAASEG